MFIKTDVGYINRNHIIRLEVSPTKEVDTYVLKADMSNGKVAALFFGTEKECHYVFVKYFSDPITLKA